MKNTMLVTTGLVVGVVATAIFYSLALPMFQGGSITKNLPEDEAKNYFLMYRQVRLLADVDGRDDNMTEGYIDLTKAQLNALLRETSNSSIDKIRVYSGYDGKNYSLMVNGFDANGNEYNPTKIIQIQVGGIRPNDCPKYCEVTGTALFSK
ncbi:MAG: hypothetical protein JST62_11700 [Bacteroidetes bacterium]|nr:hypothetical protein [Bacteroidota bacterium]